MPLNKRTDYVVSRSNQAAKPPSVAKSKLFVATIRELLLPFLAECEPYEPEASSRVGGAPAVKLPNGLLAIAPDLRAITHSGRVLWIEAKDKSQRFYYPDTGADAHQVVGWYDVWSSLLEPVLVVFQDPPFEACLPREGSGEARVLEFRQRWDRFGGKPYGAWLSEALADDGGSYPMLSPEHTRTKFTYILYFDVGILTPLVGGWERLVNEVEHDLVPPLPKSLVAYSKDGVLYTEAEVRKKAFEAAGGR